MLGDMVIKMRQDTIERRRKAQEKKDMANPDIQINWNPSATELVSKHLKRATRDPNPHATHQVHIRNDENPPSFTACGVQTTYPQQVYARTAMLSLCPVCFLNNTDELIIDGDRDDYLIDFQRKYALVPIPAVPVDNEAPDWRTKTLPATVHYQEDRDHEMWVKANPDLGTPMQKPEPTKYDDTLVVRVANRTKAIQDYICGFVDLDYVKTLAYPLITMVDSDDAKEGVLKLQIEDERERMKNQGWIINKTVEKSKEVPGLKGAIDMTVFAPLFKDVKAFIVYDKDGGQSLHQPSDVSIVMHANPEENVTDEINHPSRYTQYKGVEVIDITEQLNFNRGNAVKYIARAGFKSEDTEIKDLQKALWYVERELAREVDSHSLGYLEIVGRLVEQMNYHRGNAVWLIAAAGEVSDRNTVRWDLTEATHSIKAEIKRLERLMEDSE